METKNDDSAGHVWCAGKGSQYERVWSEIKIGKNVEGIEPWNQEYEELGIPESATFDEIVKSLEDALAEDKELYFDIKPGKVRETLIAAYSKPFKLATTATPKKYSDGLKELWIGGKCIAISEKKFKSFRDKLWNYLK